MRRPSTNPPAERRPGSPLIGGAICVLFLGMLVLIGHGAFRMITGGSRSGAAPQGEVMTPPPAPAPATKETKPEAPPFASPRPTSTIII